MGHTGQKERKLYLEVLRSIAILLVIFNHTDGFFLYYTSTDNPLTFAYSLFFSVLCRVDVPLFFMISGALLLEREESLGELLRKRILRIAAVIVLFSAVQYGVDVLRGRALNVSATYFLKGVVCGTIEETYWFLYAYLGILLLLPFLRAMVKGLGREQFRYLFLLELLLAVLMPAVSSFTGWSLPSSVYILNVNIFYMLMGYALDRELIRSGPDWAVPAAAAAGMLLSVAVCLLRFALTGTYLQGDLDLFTPLLSVAVFEAVRLLWKRIVCPDGVKRGISCLGSAAFGIYLVEQLVRILLLPMYLYLCEHAVGVIACTAYVAGTWLISLALTLILKCVPGLKKIL